MAVNNAWAFLMPLVIGLLMAVGPILLLLAALRRDRFLAPRCRKCGYELRGQLLEAYAQQPVNAQARDAAKAHDLLAGRACQECGADLASAKAIKFGDRPQGTWGLAIVGGLMALAPAAFMVGAILITYFLNPVTFAGPGNLANQPTAAIIQTAQSNPRQPWAWQELHNRLSSGGMSDAELDHALRALEQSLRAAHASGQQPQQYHYAQQFMTEAIARSPANDPELDAALQAWFEPGLNPAHRDKIRSDQAIGLRLNRGGQHVWLNGYQTVCAVPGAATADGTPLTILSDQPQDNGTNPDWRSWIRGWTPELKIPAGQLEPGEHEIVLTVDHGVVLQNAVFLGVDGRPGQKQRWPSPITTWRSDVRTKIEVVPADVSPLEAVTDPAQYPSGLKPPTLVARKSGGSRPQLAIQWQTQSGDLALPVGAHVFMVVGGTRHPIGTLSLGANRNHTANYSRLLPNIGGDVRTVDLILEPDSRQAEQLRDATRYWAAPIEFKNVPIRRADLD